LCLFNTTLILDGQEDYWQQIPTPEAQIRSFTINSDDQIFIGLNYDYMNGGVYQTSNNGETWDYIGITGSVLSLVINEFDNIFAGSEGLFFSDNNGLTWDTLSGNIMVNSIFIENDLILVGNWYGVYKSEDQGFTWDHVLIFPGGLELVKDIIQNMTTGEVFAATTNYFDGGGVYKSIDGGSNWEQFGLYNHYITSLAFNSDDDLFAGSWGHNLLGNGGLYELPYGQDDWICLTNEFHINDIVVNDKDQIFISTSSENYTGGVLTSNDQGLTWDFITNELGTMGFDKLNLDSSGYLYAMTHFWPNKIFKSNNSTLTAIPESPEIKLKLFNSPNPFDGVTTIYFSPDIKNFDVKVITIYNSLGEKVKEILIPSDSNINAVVIKMEDYTPGIYYCGLLLNGIVYTNKMILI